MMRVWPLTRTALIGGALLLVVVTALALAWLRWDANRDREAWLDERKGILLSATKAEGLYAG